MYHTSRDECFMIDILVKHLDSKTFKDKLIDIELHIERQKDKIRSDIKHLQNEIEDKQYDIQMYEWLEKQIEKMKVSDN